MSMFPHTVTLYNTVTETDKATLEDSTVNYITVLHGVLCDESKAANVRESGLVGADAVDLYIPFGVKAVDGITGKEKRYAGPLEFWRAEDRASIWSLSDSGNTFFIKGEIVELDASRELIEMKYDGVYSVTKVDTKDLGGLQHWEVGGN